MSPTRDIDSPLRRSGAAAVRRTRWVLRDPALAGAALLLGAIVLIALLVPLLWPHSPNAVDVGSALDPPSLHHPMGTDASGRDLLARFAAGARISLLAGVIVVVAGGLLGGLLGIAAGMSGRFGDGVVMRAMDAVLAFPPLILAMAVSLGLGAGLTAGVVGVTLTSVPIYARLLRGEILRLRGLPHVEAARALGATPAWVMRRHVLPHTVPTMLVQSGAVFGYAILTLAGLSFIGLGAQIPTPEWGAMITDGLRYALTGGWWVATFPGLGLVLAVVGVNLLADRVRDLLDPRGLAARS